MRPSVQRVRGLTQWRVAARRRGARGAAGLAVGCAGASSSAGAMPTTRRCARGGRGRWPPRAVAAGLELREGDAGSNATPSKLSAIATGSRCARDALVGGPHDAAPRRCASVERVRRARSRSRSSRAPSGVSAPELSTSRCVLLRAVLTHFESVAFRAHHQVAERPSRGRASLQGACVVGGGASGGRLLAQAQLRPAKAKNTAPATTERSPRPSHASTMPPTAQIEAARRTR